jgi:hypothetical protein
MLRSQITVTSLNAAAASLLASDLRPNSEAGDRSVQLLDAATVKR